MDTGFIFLVIALSIAGFVVLREFLCWYFKINKKMEILDEILEQLKTLNSSTATDDKKDDQEKSLIKEKEEVVEENEDKSDESDGPVEDPFWNKK